MNWNSDIDEPQWIRCSLKWMKRTLCAHKSYEIAILQAIYFVYQNLAGIAFSPIFLILFRFFCCCLFHLKLFGWQLLSWFVSRFVPFAFIIDVFNEFMIFVCICCQNQYAQLLNGMHKSIVWDTDLTDSFLKNWNVNVSLNNKNNRMTFICQNTFG